MVSMCAGLSRFELAQTVCELLEWRRDNGALKARECRDLLERLEARGNLRLPAKRSGRPKGRRTSTARTDRGERRGEIAGALPEVAPVELQLAHEAEGRALWRELLARYHYLGYATPFGAQLVYLICSQRRVVDPARFAGTCYRAANSCEVGETSGRGRMDREHQRHGRCVKRVFLYPLHPEARERLRGER
jgi:Druantia protein DruA